MTLTLIFLIFNPIVVVPDRSSSGKSSGGRGKAGGGSGGLIGGVLVDSFTGLLKYVWTGGMMGGDEKTKRQAKISSSEIIIV